MGTFIFLFLLATMIEMYPDEEIKEKNPQLSEKIQKIFEIQDDIENIHPFLKHLFPIAVVKNDTFYVFDLDPCEEIIFSLKNFLHRWLCRSKSELLFRLISIISLISYSRERRNAKNLKFHQIACIFDKENS